MASVSSLDQDMRKLRLDRYTPAAANEVRSWIETTLGEKLPAGDLMEVLRDGVALCKLINIAVQPGVKFKASSMPFVQMENISHFLKACEMPPLNLPAHDRFLTVDLYDQKDPAQVLQCLSAFSRRANIVNPGAVSTTLGAKGKADAMSPQGTGGSHTKSPSYTINTPPKHEPVTAFNPLNRAAYSGRSSPTKQGSLSRGGLAVGGPVSSWSKSSDEDRTTPAWNIHQYGYMGGASQGNQGIAFGARRQIVSQGPEVPSLAEKEKRLKAKEEEQKAQAEADAQRQRDLAEQEEARAKEEEEQRWEEETKRLKAEELRAQRAEEERQRRQDQAEQAQKFEITIAAQRKQERQISDSRLNGQFLSQYQAGQGGEELAPQNSEAQRIAELERQLAEMKEAEKERQRQERDNVQKAVPAAVVEPKPQPSPRRNEPQTSHEDDWDASERDFLKKQLQAQKEIEAENRGPAQSRPADALISNRPLPDPSKFTPGKSRTDRFLSSNPAPEAAAPTSHRPADFSTTAEVDMEDQRRVASQQKTKAGGWASKSLLEREMERERERQREWEENQKATAARKPNVDEGSGAGQSWDIHQYGYTGGDSQNRGGPGLGVGGARRQIIGPRPPP